MKKLLLVALALVLWAAPARAQFAPLDVTVSSGSITVAGVSAPTAAENALAVRLTPDAENFAAFADVYTYNQAWPADLVGVTGLAGLCRSNDGDGSSSLTDFDENPAVVLCSRRGEGFVTPTYLGIPLATANGVIGQGPVADGVATAGNPLYVGGLSTSSITAQTPVATAQRIGFVGGLDRVQITRPYANLEDRISGHVANTDGAATSLVAAQGAGVRGCFTTLIVSNSSATNVTVALTDGSGGTTLATLPAGANMGGSIVNLPVPICTTANTALFMDGSAAATTVSVTAIGFKTEL